MAPTRDLDPSSSVLGFFGSELRRFREASGLTQDRLGEVVNYTGSLVGLVETARRKPSREFTERCDAALGTDGALARIWPLLGRPAFPSWFRGFVELESTATSVATYQAQVVPGLLQTEEYAWAVIRKGRTGEPDEVVAELVAARMSRQTILDGPTPPLLWVVLDEAVLRRPVGGPAVMRHQLERLLDVARSPRVVMQVLPFAAGAHTALDGSMTLLSFTQGPDVAHLEGPYSGQLIDRPEDVARYTLAYHHLRADALSPDASLTAVETAMEEVYTP
ncbi:MULTISPECIES: helix-turn-helix domain-containing protein [Kitasatospora]|uniref:Helix-turn-helix transcriptional regulator n=1 Tax=Kitasatospora arboriphila TaxID=258052 RepID=A0ABN1U635_9ACTN